MGIYKFLFSDPQQTTDRDKKQVLIPYANHGERK